MLPEEFKALTGFDATPEEYKEIEQQYYDFAGDKVEFCQKWRKYGMPKVAAKRQERVKLLEDRVTHLLKEQAEMYEYVEQLENWQPSNCGTHMSQEEYIKLRQAGKRLEMGEAADKIAQLFGFDKSKVEVIEFVETFERNSLGKIRTANRYKRHPVYDATDWNYMRFDCTGQQWEMVNGELRGYEG